MIFNTLRNSVANLMPKIHNLPFNRELAKGTLALEKFTFYLAQDALYLTDYSKALALTANRLPHEHQKKIFIQFSINAIQAERELHYKTLKKYIIADNLKREQSPFCFMYTNYLLNMAHSAPVEVAVASLLPCFWVYQQVGQKALAEKNANNPYQEWINSYSNPEFNNSVNLAITTINELGEHSSDHTKQKMIAAFMRATELEYYFWQGTYTQQVWLTYQRQESPQNVNYHPGSWRMST